MTLRGILCHSPARGRRPGSLASDPDSHYRAFVIQSPGKKPRQIDNPDQDLKTLQRQIRTRLLAPLQLPTHVHGCVKGRSPLTNAKAHGGQPNVASIDIKNFYPSVTNKAIGVWQRLGYGPRLASLLTRLTPEAGGQGPSGRRRDRGEI